MAEALEEGGIGAGAPAARWSELAELRDVPEAELRRLLKQGFAVAWKKTRSVPLAKDVVSDVVHKLTTTRRWQPDRGPLADHFFGAIHSEISNRFTSKAGEREDAAHEGFHRETRPAATQSAEEMAVGREEQEERRSTAAKTVERLLARVSGRSLCARIVRALEDGEEMKPSALASRLGVTREEIYVALRQLRYHVQRIGESERDSARDVMDEGAKE